VISSQTIKEEFERESRPWEISKFHTFNTYLRSQSKQIRLVVGFMARRLATIVALCLNGIILYVLYLQNFADSFICHIKNLPEVIALKGTDNREEITPNEEHVEELHRCTIEDIQTRILLCYIYVVFVFIAVVIAICEIWKDMKRCKNSIQTLTLCPLIEIPPLSTFSLCGVSDLHILLLLAAENMAEHKIFRYCLDAREMSYRLPKTDTTTAPDTVLQPDAPYLGIMVTKIAWAMPDESDQKTVEILKAFAK